MKDYMEKDDYVLCPVCGKEKFYLDDYFIFCNHCGWEGNIKSDEHFIELNGFSIRDYKKIYQEYLKIHPNFIWKEDKNALNNYINSFINFGSKCPVCGEELLDVDYKYCYKCGWKNSYIQVQYPDFADSINKLSLNDYRERFNNNIKDNPKYIWKNTSDSKILFDDKQLKWLKDNSIKEFDKLTSDDELHQIFDSIEKIQKQYESKDKQETYMFIKSILDIILDNM